MRFAELAIFTDDVDSVAQFYERLLGFAAVHRGDGIAIFKADGTNILIHKTYVPAPGELPCENHVAFAVADVDQSVTELQSRGMSMEFPPKDYDWGRSAYLRDPEGRLVEIQQEQEGRG